MSNKRSIRELCNALNFTTSKSIAPEKAPKIHKWGSPNYRETLLLYCADNDISLDDTIDFDSAVKALKTHGQDDKAHEYYYFWID